MAFDDAKHMTFDGPWLLEVRCRGCGAVTMLRRKGDRLATPTEAYAELAIEMVMPNGLLAKHETGMCVACRDRLLTTHDMPTLRAIFASDVKHMIRAALRAGHPRAKVMLAADRFAQWTPLRAIGVGRLG